MVAIGDLDVDGRPDLAVANEDSGTACVLLNTSPRTSSGPFPLQRSTLHTLQVPARWRSGTWMFDGRPDLAVANQYSNTVWVFRNTGAGAELGRRL